MSNYLTPEDYEIAEKNGIHKRMAYDRFYYCNWSKERAITELPKLSKYKILYSRYEDVAVVNQRTFRDRILRGWDPEKAATTRHKSDTGIITKDVIAFAERNGIGLSALRQRVYTYRWTIERAMTEPIHKEKRKKS